jgi:beta-lactamase regulating signal transducer with metallopeptidase domain
MIQESFAAYLLNAAWQAPVVALCALIVTRFGGLSAQARNRVWLGFLAMAVILPGVALDAILPHALPTVARVAPAAAASTMDLATLAAEPPPAAEPALRLEPWSAWMLLGLFALVAAALVARLLVANAAARGLVEGSRPADLPADLTQALARLARRHNRAVPPVRSSADVPGPAVVGALRPVILIPEGVALEGEDLRAALLHELAHVLRHDYAINLACEVLTLPVSWHPALMALKAGVRRSRELACDAMAAQAMSSQKTYAKCLVSLAQTLGAQTLGAQTLGGSNHPTQAALAVGLFGRSDLEDRLMQLMKPNEAEAPLVRAARLTGLAALGAGLLGSTALLHVTPVFAQQAPTQQASGQPAARVAAAPAPAAAAAARQAADDAGASITMVHRRHGLIYSRKGVVFEVGDNGHRHSFKASNGETITVVNDDPDEPTAEQQRAWEAEARDAEAKADAAEALVNSPEFKARIAKAKADGEAARRMVESPEFKAKIAKARADGEAARKMVESPEFKARIAKAQAEGEAAQARVNSPEFRAMIAKARADGEAARKMVESPEFKARIDAARASGEAARAYTESAEFKAQMARIREDSAEMRRDMAEWRARERARGTPTP